MSVAVTSPRFTSSEVATLLAARRKANEPRGRHGLPLAETTRKENQGRYRVPLPITDFAEDALQRTQKKYAAQWPEADMSSLLWRVEEA